MFLNRVLILYIVLRVCLLKPLLNTAMNKPNTLKQLTKKNQKEISASTSKVWSSIVKNYEMIQGAQLSNSFILLMALNEAKVPLTPTQISELAK
jgi:hypothetical protein